MTPIHCNNCGRTLAEGNRFCPGCGASVTPGILGPAPQDAASCPNCGLSEVGNGLFCIRCRQFLKAPPGVHVAGLGRRVAAYLLDAIIPVIPALAFVVLAFGDVVVDFDDNGEPQPAQEQATIPSPADLDQPFEPSTDDDVPAAATPIPGQESVEDDSISFPPTYLLLLLPTVAYFVWWLIVLSRGQTPGKQLMSIRVIRADGRASGWGWTFLREFGIKGVLVNAVSWLSAGIGLIVWIGDLLWAFWDKDRQTLHDKIMKTVVIDERTYRETSMEQQSTRF